MKYDQSADALYLKLTDHPVVSSKQINPDFAVDLDENGQVIGIEVLNVRKSGIDPFAVEILHVAPDAGRPDPEAIQNARVARMEALKRQRQKQVQ